MTIEVTSEVLEAVRAEAERAYPHEACGILLGEGSRIHSAVAARNVDPDPSCRFEIDPRALIDAHRAARGGAYDVVGYFHSHPHGPAEPSATDIAEAAPDGAIWLIVGGQDIAVYRAIPRGGGRCRFEPLRLTVRDSFSAQDQEGR